MDDGFQFSLRLLLVGIAAIAVALAAIAATPSWPSLAALESLAVFFATTGVLAVRNTAGRIQTFWIGCSMVLVVGALVAGASLAYFSLRIYTGSAWITNTLADFDAAAQSLRRILPAFWLSAPINGLLARIIHDPTKSGADCAHINPKRKRGKFLALPRLRFGLVWGHE